MEKGAVMIDYEYLKPKNLEEVFSLLKSYGEKAVLIAGGTDVMVNIRNKKLAPEALISLRGLEDLAYVKKDEGAYRIGALTRWTYLQCRAIRGYGEPPVGTGRGGGSPRTRGGQKGSTVGFFHRPFPDGTGEQ